LNPSQIMFFWLLNPEAIDVFFIFNLATYTHTHTHTNYFFSYDPPYSRGNIWLNVENM
jgi:hypothetical protein